MGAAKSEDLSITVTGTTIDAIATGLKTSYRLASRVYNPIMEDSKM